MDQEQQSRWRPTRRQLLWAGGIAAILTIAVLIGYRYGITLWDWIKLLIVPAVIAGAASGSTGSSKNASERITYSNKSVNESSQSVVPKMKPYKHTWMGCRNC